MGGIKSILVFPHIVPGVVAGRTVAEIAHVTRTREIFKVASPAHFFPLQDIRNGRDILGNADRVIMVEAEVVAAYGSEVIGLTWMCVAIVSSQQNALPL